MIIFQGSGRLGNQIFQLYFLESIRKKNECVLSTGMGQVCHYFEGFQKLHNTDSRFFISIFDAIIVRFLKLFVKIHLIGSAIEMHNVGFHKETKGLLPIRFAFGYFQCDSYIKKNSNIHLKEEYLNKAKDQLLPYSNKTKIFIHVRHGDYDKSLVLPDSFYQKGIDSLQKEIGNFSNTVFILLGDDPTWSQKNFSFLPSYFIPKNDLITDFALMTLCDGAIISNSTFAWLGAYFCKSSFSIYAPKYWAGWKTKEWYPKQIQTDRFKFIDI